MHVQVPRRGHGAGQVARLGIFGGAFNPPHLGHLVCAQEACVQLELDSVVLVPVFSAPHREIYQDPGTEARFEMCELAVAGDARLSVSRIELERGGPSYTVDTLRQLDETRKGDDLRLILGADQAAALGSWREPEAVVEIARVGVAERSGVVREDLVERLSHELPGTTGRIDFFDMPRMDISASMVRRRATSGLPIRYLVPDGVADYIGARSFYGASAPAGASA